MALSLVFRCFSRNRRNSKLLSEDSHLRKAGCSLDLFGGFSQSSLFPPNTSTYIYIYATMNPFTKPSFALIYPWSKVYSLFIKPLMSLILFLFGDVMGCISSHRNAIENSTR